MSAHRCCHSSGGWTCHRMVLVSGWPFIGCKNRVKQNDTLKIFYLGLGSWQCVSSTNHHSKLSFWWLDASWLMVVGWWWLSVAVIVLSDTSSLINLNFSVTKMNSPESSMPVEEAVIALINHHFGDGGERRMVAAQRGCQLSSQAGSSQNCASSFQTPNHMISFVIIA